jgi:hypothetical protein
MQSLESMFEHGTILFFQDIFPDLNGMVGCYAKEERIEGVTRARDTKAFLCIRCCHKKAGGYAISGLRKNIAKNAKSNLLIYGRPHCAPRGTLYRNSS